MTRISLHRPETWKKDYKQIVINTFQKFSEKDFEKFLRNEFVCHRISQYMIEPKDNKIITVFYEER